MVPLVTRQIQNIEHVFKLKFKMMNRPLSDNVEDLTLIQG